MSGNGPGKAPKPTQAIPHAAEENYREFLAVPVPGVMVWKGTLHRTPWLGLSPMEARRNACPSLLVKTGAFSGIVRWGGLLAPSDSTR